MLVIPRDHFLQEIDLQIIMATATSTLFTKMRTFRKPTSWKKSVNAANISAEDHEANKTWCLLNGDSSQKSWEDSPQWQKDSAINGVKFRLENFNADIDRMHNNWMEEKIADGWVYGEIKDPEKKEHPCIVPFTELPMEQQIKDALFRSIIHAMFN